MAFNKSQKAGFAIIGAFALGTVTLIKWDDIGIGWTLGAWAGFIALCVIIGKAGNRR